MGLPPNPSSRHFVSLVVLHGTDQQLAQISGLPILFRYEDGVGFLVHISSIPFLQKLGFITGYQDARAQMLVVEYLKAARDTFGPGRFHTLPGDDYPWGDLFTDELEPREYQFAAMSHIWHRARLGLSRMSLIGDDVGMGKTVEAFGVLARLVKEGIVTAEHPAVIVTLSYLKSQISDELKKFVKNLPPFVVVEGTAQERRDKLRQKVPLYITHYEVLRLGQYAAPVAELRDRLRAVIFDETGAIKNAESQTNQKAREFCAGARVVVGFNATPMEKNIMDVYGQCSAMEPRMLADPVLFAGRYVTLDARGSVTQVHELEELKLRIGAAHLRRTKDECKVQMPEIVTELRRVSLPPAQATAYTQAVGDAASEKGAVGLAKLAVAQRALLAADMGNLQSESVKLDDLAALLDGNLRGERVIVFSRFETIVAYAAQRLAKFQPFVISGKVNETERTAIRRRFEHVDGAGRLLIGTDAMARGLNLQAAGVVVNLDLPWTAAQLRQRVGRIARSGQRRATVLVLNYVATMNGQRTLDDYLVHSVLSRRDQFRQMFNDDAVDEIGVDPGTFDLNAVFAYLAGRKD